MGKTFRQMADEIREVNTALGWRLDKATFGDLVALVHTEVSEAAEAFRDHRLADATRPSCGHTAVTGEVCQQHGLSKPEGVGNELGDVLIRLIDLSDIFGITAFEPDFELGDVAPFHRAAIDWPAPLDTFGDYVDWMHHCITGVVLRRDVPTAIRALVTFAEKFGVDLEAEYKRKIAYNRTREFQHGGRTMSGAKA